LKNTKPPPLSPRRSDRATGGGGPTRLRAGAARRRELFALTLLAVGVAVLGAVPTLPSAAGGPVGTRPAPLVHPQATCTGSSIGSHVAGALSVLGTEPPVPSSAAVNLTISYTYQVAVTAGGSTSYSCTSAAFVVTTDGSGDFAGNITLPSGGCTRGSCTSYSGPYTPDGVALTDAAPTGYFLNGTLEGNRTRLELVAAFQRISVDPPGPLTISLNANTTFGAFAWTANGKPSPALVADGWSLSGSGWSLNRSGGSSVTVVATGSVAPTTLTLVANATYRGVGLAGLTTSLGLNAVATEVTAASVAPTTVDVGAHVFVSAVGTGAEGYGYSATFYPGLGIAPVNASCEGVPIAGGELSVSCEMLAVYNRTGVAQPFFHLTNGFSTALWTFPELAVNPPLGISATPDPLRGYVATPLSVTLAVAAGSGTGPYAGACLAPGTGGLLCDPGPATSWSFAPVYPRPGLYLAAGHVLDAGGTNATVPLPVVIADRPSLGPIAASTQRAPIGLPVNFTALVAGGVAPLAYWWNDSDPGTTFASGSLPGAGPVDGVETPREAGTHTITLTVVDALGTVVAGAIELVVPSAAAQIAAVGGRPATDLVAGVPQAMAWVALGADGARSPSYAAALTISIVGGPLGPTPIWLNSSVPGSSASTGPGEFALNASAWYGGYLNFTITIARSGTYELGLSAPVPAAFAPSGGLRLTVGPELRAMRLFDPEVLVAGARTNHTLWHLADPFGNPAPAGELYLLETFGGPALNVSVPIVSNGSASWAFVNYSAPSSGAGLIRIEAPWNETLGVLVVPAASPPDVVPLLVALVGGAGAAGVGTAFYLRRRERPGPGEAGAEELRRYAEGREEILERLRSAGPLDVDGLLRARLPTRPDRAEATEWLTSLVTEGAVRTERGPSGRPLFVPVLRPKAAPALRVDLDPDALDRSRELAEREGPGPEYDRE
jgi:hypothetical protein